ncbi:hypothetical protein CCOS2040_14690 [Streptomyces albidoflavus]|nr:hypothetical protein CCOS2040_14690 [Streptomyces albidoflavus]
MAITSSSSETEVAASGESWRRRYTWSGRVWVAPGRFPAKVIVAPNSPSARAQVRAAPAASAGASSGSVTVAKTRSGPAPSEAAVSSSEGRSPASAPSRLITRNGIATKAAATTAPAVWNGRVSPKVDSSHGPSTPRRPKASSRATPPTVGGSTMGSSTSERTSALPGNGTRASSQASGTPISSESSSAQPETTSDSRSAWVTCGVVRWWSREGQSVLASTPTSGSSRKATPTSAGTSSPAGTPRRTAPPAPAPGLPDRTGPPTTPRFTPAPPAPASHPRSSVHHAPHTSRRALFRPPPSVGAPHGTAGATGARGAYEHVSERPVRHERRSAPRAPPPPGLRAAGTRPSAAAPAPCRRRATSRRPPPPWRARCP